MAARRRTSSSLGNRGRFSFIVVAMLLTAWLTSQSVARAATSHTNWVAGWVPHGDRLLHAGLGRGASRMVTYGRSAGREDVSIEVNPTGGQQELPPCNPQALRTSRTTIRGHTACRYTDFDEDQPFGTILVWREEPNVIISVELYSLDVATARRVADHVKPVDAATWARLVESTTFVSTANVNSLKMQRKQALAGSVNGTPWTLTVLVPDGFPLGPDDHRDSCFELRYGTKTKLACTSDAYGGSTFVRLAGQVFAFGSVPASVARVSLQLDPDGSSRNAAASTPQIASAPAVHVKPLTRRFFVAPLPNTACGADVVDATHPHPRRVVGFAPGRPFDPTCTGFDIAKQPPPNRAAAPATESP